MTPNPITVNPEESLSQVLYLLSYYKLSRLPVIDRHKLVGIITRSDILRAQSKRLRGVSSQITKPSYLVYQRRDVATGKGRILLPLSNLQTAPYLIEIGLAIAKAHDYEIECLHVIPLASHLSLSETRVDLNPSLKILELARIAAISKDVSLHTEIRIAHDVAQTILEVASDRLDLLLIGWHGKSINPERLFGDIVDTVLKQAECDVMLVKFSDRLQKFNPFKQEFKKPQISFNRWLIPIASDANTGANTEHAILLLPALINLSPYPEIYLCQVFSPNDKDYDVGQLEKYADLLYKTCNFSAGTISVCSKSIADAIVDLANQQRSDVIMLGASNEGLLQEIIHGNIPEAIAQNSNRTIFIFRKGL
jgi:CIC family chloride channel protein